MSRPNPNPNPATGADATPAPAGELARQRAFPEHLFQFSAHQLCFMCKCLSETRTLDGAIVEIGCEYGHTTVFLNNYIDDLVGQNRPYYAIDTFAGFTESDVRFEAEHRGKQGIAYQDFKENRKDWFERTMRLNRIERVRAIQADINEFDLPSLGPLSFVLLDVDLYRPTRKALPQLYQQLLPGGVLVVDDCNPASNQWDGAYQAYIEFVRSLNATPRIMYTKLGVIRKPLPPSEPS